MRQLFGFSDTKRDESHLHVFDMKISWWCCRYVFSVIVFAFTVESANKEPTYKELPVIRNYFYFPNLYQGTSSLHVYKELWL